jgi:peroxiredoxin
MTMAVSKRTPLLIFFVYALAFVVTGCSNVTGSGSVTSSMGSELKQVHRFTLMNPQNDAVSLDQLLAKNKSVLINFWATWCGFCVEEMPDLVKLQARLEGQGFTVLAVDVGESAAQASAFAKKMGLNFPIVLDEDNTVAQNYGIVGIPISYLISSEGKILGEYHGFTQKLVTDVETSLKDTVIEK